MNRRNEFVCCCHVQWKWKTLWNYSSKMRKSKSFLISFDWFWPFKSFTMDHTDNSLPIVSQKQANHDWHLELLEICSQSGRMLFHPLCTSTKKIIHIAALWSWKTYCLEKHPFCFIFKLQHTSKAALSFKLFIFYGKRGRDREGKSNEKFKCKEGMNKKKCGKIQFKYFMRD